MALEDLDEYHEDLIYFRGLIEDIWSASEEVQRLIKHLNQLPRTEIAQSLAIVMGHLDNVNGGVLPEDLILGHTVAEAQALLDHHAPTQKLQIRVVISEQEIDLENTVPNRINVSVVDGKINTCYQRG